jgi:hypothetical protein
LVDRFDHPAMAWPRVGVVPVVQAIEQALVQQRGFALVRLGDGEGSVLAHDEPGMADMLALCRGIWFGDQALAPAEWDAMREALRGAVRAADVLGLPRHRQCLHTHGALGWQAAVQGAHATLVGLPYGRLMVDTAMHNYLQWSGGVARLLRGRAAVTVVGCRDVGALLRQHLGLRAVHWVAVRGEAAHAGAVAERHWPEGYAQTLQALEQVQPGALCLVGAGVLGKAYCAAIKARGGVAIDVGSLMDGWAGIASRQGLTDQARARLDWAAGLPASDADLIANVAAIIGQTHITDGTF